MIISTKRGTPAAELDKIIREFEAKGLSVTMIRGTDYNVFGLVGDTTVIDEKQVRANPYVENVQRVSEPYKKANRLFHEADSIIDVGGIKVGGSEKIAVIGGPCSIESEEQAVRIAREVKDAGGCMAARTSRAPLPMRSRALAQRAFWPWRRRVKRPACPSSAS